MAEFALHSVDGLRPNDVLPSIADHHGAPALRLVLTPDAETPDCPTFAIVEGVEFGDGVIELEVAGDALPDAPPAARGFIGVAFRIKDDLSAFEGIYIRPKNGRAGDQLRRNRSCQYFSYPDYKFDYLRETAAGEYESYVDLVPGAWTKMRIEVAGETARLYVHGAEQPTLVVNDLKHGAGARGGIGLYIDSGTEGFFRGLKVTG
ncbi:MAG: hypothetical protein QGH73_08460 [Rhodospirillales bacterium]|jgi:hypothetical protein|nr:hypothetical protein [Rhodospirillaceae bacterium]MDP6427243.1 hypothetical protein [Rhodospirillales bacterium]MDP6645439.1 hypothetical protein [Rhodospirillales bacterium]MDP6841697.1 hypothetical protein [Rhodospirillales bacterium]|tara:strand:- start:409 stop:1023 length:615 start_codon:yes stop_codon:yes gene_type:complete